MKNKTWSRYKYLLASAPRLSTRLGHVGGLFSFRGVSVQFARRAPSIAASNAWPGVDTDPGRGVLAARRKLWAGAPLSLPATLWGGAPRAWLPRPNPRPSEEHEKSGARGAAGGQGHSLRGHAHLWVSVVPSPPGTRGLSWLQEWVPRPRQPGPLQALPSLLLHQRKGAPSALTHA